MSVKVKFKIGEKKGITANYTVNNNNPIRTVFKIDAASASFYSLTGSPYDNANLKYALDAKADKSELDADMAAVDESISNVQTVVENNYNTLDTKIDNVNSDLSGDISTLENTVNSNNTAVNNRIDATNQTVADNNTAINNRVDGIVDSFDGDISALETAIQNEADVRANNDTLLQGDINTLRNDLTSEISNRTSADDTLQDNINNIQNTIDNYGDIISYNASDFATAAQGELAESALQPNDNISELNNDAGYLTNADLSGYLRNTATGSNSLTIDGIATNKTNSINIGAQSTVNNNSIALGYYATASGSTSIALGLTANAFAQNSIQIGSGANSTANTLQVRSYTLLDTSTGLIPDARLSNNIARSSDIPTFTDAQIAALNSGATTANIEQIATNTSNISSLSNTVTSNYNTLDGRITSEVNTLNGAITTEATNRQNADNALQSQIDAITSASDVFDIVGTYAELQAYDISTVPVNDIIKVLVDSTHNNAATYYRCVENNNVKSWTYIGSEGAYYTKSEADNTFVAKTTTINNKPLSNNITLTASDVNALPADTIIGSGIITLQKNGVDVDSFNVNATANKSINISVPIDTGDLTNNAGYIKDIDNTDVINALGYTPYNASNPDGFITSADLPTNYLTTDTAQSISGQKTFTSTIKSSVNNSLALTQSTGDAFGVTVKRTDANNEIRFGIGQGGVNRGIWDVRHNKWAFSVTNDGKSYTLGNEIAIKSDLNSLSPLRYSRYSIAQVNSTNKFIKLASMTFTQSGNRDFSYLFWVEILEASTAKCYALVRLSARWSNTSYQGHKFEILEKYGGSTDSLEALKNLTYAYSLNTTTHKITAEIWLEIKNMSYVSYYLRPTECNEYGDYSNTPVTLSNNVWTYYNQSGNASSIASTAITSGLTQVKVTDATGFRNENNLSQVMKMWAGTKAEYDAIVTKDSDTIYNVEDTTSPIIDILNTLYPIGAIYIGTMATCPLSVLGIGTWQLVAQDRVLQGAGTRGTVGSTVNESLPNHRHTASKGGININTKWSAGSILLDAPSYGTKKYTDYASIDNSTYQDNAPVQQDAYLVNIWERTA